MPDVVLVTITTDRLREDALGARRAGQVAVPVDMYDAAKLSLDDLARGLVRLLALRTVDGQGFAPGNSDDLVLLRVLSERMPGRRASKRRLMPGECLVSARTFDGVGVPHERLAEALMQHLAMTSMFSRLGAAETADAQ